MSDLRTSLYDTHLKHQAKMVAFAGWLMPLHYGSQLQEHLAVRQHAGMFDVSHMCIIDIHGPDAQQFLRFLLANDVAKLEKSGPGKALYTLLLNEHGGIMDDAIVYFLKKDAYRLIVNAATRAKDLAWIKHHAQAYKVHIQERQDLSIIAVQGPEALRLVKSIKPEWMAALDALKPFQAFEEGDWLIARTGYTGEEGLEILCPNTEAPAFWEQLSLAGIQATGLGARDTLRLEAGMNLYGHDMNEDTFPQECGLTWTLDFHDHDRHFCGKEALLKKMSEGFVWKQVGLVLEDKGVLREGLKVITSQGPGVITSGTFSPVLHAAIAFARVPIATESPVHVELRGELKAARIVKLPFVRRGQQGD